jgi:hypothetical protein
VELQVTLPDPDALRISPVLKPGLILRRGGRREDGDREDGRDYGYTEFHRLMAVAVEDEARSPT